MTVADRPTPATAFGTSRETVRVLAPAGSSNPDGAVVRLARMSWSDVLEKSDRHQPPCAYVSGSMANADGGSANDPRPMSGSVRITGVVFAGISSITPRTSSGGET